VAGISPWVAGEVATSLREPQHGYLAPAPRASDCNRMHVVRSAATGRWWWRQ
jgi:hypothetical protein